MQVITTERGTPEWRAAHRFCITANDVPSLLADRGSKTYNRVVDRLVHDFEGIGLHTDEFPDPWAESHEQDLRFALALFEKRASLKLGRIGFVVSDTFSWLGCSPHALTDSSIYQIRVRKSLRTYRERCDIIEPREISKLQTMLFITGRDRVVVIDYWDAGDDALSRMQTQELPFDHAHLTGDVLPRLAKFWQDVAEVKRRRA